MAPNFLTKLVNKSPSTQTRDRSLSSPSPPSSRSRTPSFVDDSMSSRNTSAFSSNPTDNTIFRSANPSVTVTVIPPSPVVKNGDVPDFPTYRSPGQKIDGMPRRGDPSPLGSEESGIATNVRPPVPTKPVPATRPPTPKNPERTPTSSPQMPTNNLPTVRRQVSNKSLKQQAQEQPVPVPPVPAIFVHMRAATSPYPLHFPDDEEPVPMPNTLTESPTALRPTEFPHTSATTSWASATSPNRRNTDVLSITSQGQKEKPTSRPWRRSAPKKPMGLAGAIAASGLAMANPGMTAPHQSTLGPQVMNQNENKSSPSLVTSPISNPNRKLTASPDAMSVHHRHRTGTNGKSHREATDYRRRRRRTTGAVMSQGEGDDEEQGEYYSGLEESSDESGNVSGRDGGSDSEDLDLGEDDIPVTGFAVASNKRNADFHELFPGIPEGDYLIEDYGCALQREILIQGRIYISENHICFHANIFGWVTDLSIPIYEITTLEKRMTAFVIPNAIRIGTPSADHTFASFLSRDTTFDVIHNIWRLARPGDAVSIGSGSMDGIIVEGTVIGGAASSAPGGKPQHKATICACGKEGSHFTETAMDTVVPGTPDRIHNLIFASGFMKDFMAVNQKLLDIRVADWTPTKPDSKLLARNMSYIKPLYASLGPKQTKCEIRDETVHVDFDDYASTLTTTRTPDVPSGGVFSVKTRTCIMWASPLSTKVVVTTQVDWTGRSLIKGIIERSAIEGQKVYHSDLDKAMRAYIQEHQSEFMPEGVDLAEIVVPEPAVDAAPVSAGLAGEPSSEKKREQERNQRGLQWAWDTFDGASQVAKQSTEGALELIRDGWENSSGKTILYFMIIALVFSNVWTYMRMGSAVENGRRKEKELAKVEDKEQWVAGVVTALWDELASGKLTVAPVASPTAEPILPSPIPGVPTSAENLKLEISTLEATLDAVEERLRLVRESLGMQSLNNVD